VWCYEIAAQRGDNRGMIPAALGLALLALVEVQLRAGDQPELAVLLGLAATLPLLLARAALVAALVITACATVVGFLSPEVPETFAGLVGQAWVLYLVAVRHRGRVAIALGVGLVVLLAFSPDADWARAALLVLGLGALALGNSRRLRGEVSAAREDQAVLQERARIARELHDVVAHHVSAIAIQADTGRLTVPAGAERFEAIGDTAREALTEMRRVLGVLRTGDAERAPQPGLDGLGELVATARASGTDVRLVVEGAARTLSPGVELTAYRVLQEALTNARRHAPGASVEVRLRYSDEALAVRVRDDGPGSAAEPGLGLRGMRERVAMVGGELVTRSDGGFVVEARLPA
jgi:signal transduction histidine kinase